MTQTTLTPSEVANKFAGREFPFPLHAFQGTIATATIAGGIADRKMLLRGIRAEVGTTGTATATTLQAHVNGAAVTGAEVTIDNTDSDGTSAQAAPDAETIVNPGDVIELAVSAAPTGGADLAATMDLVEVFD